MTFIEVILKTQLDLGLYVLGLYVLGLYVLGLYVLGDL